MPSALFIYGTLLDARVFARLAGRAPLRRAMPARARGFTRVILRGTPYPTLRRADATAVDGLLLPRIGNDARRRLAAYEGASYRLAPIRVVTRRGPRFARAWLAPAWRAAQLPWAPLRARM